MVNSARKNKSQEKESPKLKEQHRLEAIAETERQRKKSVSNSLQRIRQSPQYREAKATAYSNELRSALQYFHMQVHPKDVHDWMKKKLFGGWDSKFREKNLPFKITISEVVTENMYDSYGGITFELVMPVSRWTSSELKGVTDKVLLLGISVNEASENSFSLATIQTSGDEYESHEYLSSDIFDSLEILMTELAKTVVDESWEKYAVDTKYL